MDAFTGRALDAFLDDVRSLLPDPQTPSLDTFVDLDRVRVRPVGLGGYVGPADDPPGDITGRQIGATVTVAVVGSDRDDVGDRAAAVRAALLTVAPDGATSGRFVRVAQAAPGPVEVVQAPGAGRAVERELRFDVLYELLESPTDTSGVISDIPVDLLVSRSGRPARAQRPVRFVPGVLDEFEVVDDAGASNGGPSEWAFDPGTAAIVQRSAIWGGTTSGTANLRGTALVQRGTAATPARDVFVRTEVTSDRRGIGLVFRWQSPDTFYFLLLDATDGFRRIARKVDGEFADLDTPAVDDSAGYPPGAPLRLGVEVVGDHFSAFVDGQLVAEGRDEAIPQPGRVGLLARRNPTAAFSSLEVWHL